MRRWFPFSLVAVVFVSISTAADASVPLRVAEHEAQPLSQATLGGFVLKPSGLLFSLHPTEAHIVVSAVADERLKVCEDGTTFLHYWKGGCRTLGHLPVALPTSGGAVHIGFRVMPLNGGSSARITNLRVRWHCVDHDFILVRGTTRVRSPLPTFDC